MIHLSLTTDEAAHLRLLLTVDAKRKWEHPSLAADATWLLDKLAAAEAVARAPKPVPSSSVGVRWVVEDTGHFGTAYCRGCDAVLSDNGDRRVEFDYKAGVCPGCGFRVDWRDR